MQPRLEHVENDRQAFREILRILKPAGFLQFSVPNPTQYTKTKDWGYPKPEVHDHYRVYGRDLLQRFREAQPRAHILQIEAADTVTEVSDFVYFTSFDNIWIEAMQFWFKEFSRKKTTTLDLEKYQGTPAHKIFRTA